MVKMKIRHFVTKKDRYHYWQPSKLLRDQGYKALRLSDNLSEAVIEAEKLNASIDRWRARCERAPGSAEGTVAWCIRKFTSDPEFQTKSASTKSIYISIYKTLEDMVGDLHISEINRRFLYEYRDQFIDRPRRGNQILSTIQSLLSYCLDRGIISENPAIKMKMFSTDPRDQVWSTEQETAFIKAAEDAGRPFLVLGMALGIYTAQRIGDLMSLPWSGYDGEWISLTQQKTKKHVDIPVLSPLRTALEKTPKCSPIILVDSAGRPFKPARFRKWFRETCEAAGIKGMQFRDLRRTSVVRMAEQGVEVQNIAAITGHTLGATQQIMETYLPRTKKMAARVVTPMENYYRSLGRG
ncbi:MAG: tyrosine-type recombinase/integrase [Geminicoccales bacterium]